MKKQKKGLLFKIILSVFAVFAVCHIAGLHISVEQKREETAILQLELEDQTRKNEALQKALKSEIGDEQIAEIAREKLGLVMPGERVYLNSNE